MIDASSEEDNLGCQTMSVLIIPGLHLLDTYTL